MIGSTAIAHHLDREPADLDLVGTYDEAVAFRKVFGAVSFYPINDGNSIFMRRASGLICEVEIAWPDSRAERLLAFVKEHPESVYSSGWAGVPMDAARKDLVYTLKMSHRFLKNSPHFWKTMADIRLLREMNCTIPEEWMEFYRQREVDTYTYKHPNLSVGKGEFFDATMTGVIQKYDHDTVHEAVAVFDRPAYTYYLDGPVKCSRELFEAQPEAIRLAGVVEEAMVLALERSLIPFPGGKTPEEAFRFALMKVCTSITSGWFRDYAWEKHDAALNFFLESQRLQCYTERFNAALEAGVVKLKQD
jgi:hypothetical protein